MAASVTARRAAVRLTFVALVGALLFASEVHPYYQQHGWPSGVELALVTVAAVATVVGIEVRRVDRWGRAFAAGLALGVGSLLLVSELQHPPALVLLLVVGGGFGIARMVRRTRGSVE